MPASEPRATAQKNLPGIFISYRRSDTPDAVGRIYDRLIAEFGKARVFKDVDSIPLGQDFRGHLNDIVGGCAAVLAIIGPKWTDIRNEAGQKRLEDPDDFVRIELEAALARSVPVVPVLVGHAPMPAASQLPTTLASLAFRQSIEVRPDPDFHNDATRLVVALRAIIDPDAPHVQPLPGNQKHSRAPWLVTLAAATTLAALAMIAPTLHHLRETPAPELRTDIVTPSTDDPDSFALSPDGRQIVFVAKSDGTPRLWLRSLTKDSAQPLPGTDNATAPFWSPDSRSIAFFASGTLRRLDLDGGQPQILAQAASGRVTGSWGSKGVILFATGLAEPLSSIAATGGSVTTLAKMGGNAVGNGVPEFLPDGQHFLFIVYSTTDFGHYLGSLDGGNAVRLTGDDSRATYLPSGWLLQVRLDGRLVAQRLDLDKKVLVGEPATVGTNVSSVSVSATGLIAYRASGTGHRQMTWVGRSGAVLGTLGAADGSLGDPRLSPSGQQVVYVRGAQGGSDIWLQNDAREIRVTFGAGGAAFPVWSPDGNQLAFLSGTGQSVGFYKKPVNGTQTQEFLQKADKVSLPTSWSADGQYLLYFAFDPGPSPDLWILPLAGDHKPFAFLQTKFSESWGEFSPDGRWIAYQSDESGRSEVYVRRFVVPGSAGDPTTQSGQWPVSTAGGVKPVWRADGKELFYIDPAGVVVAAPISINSATVVPGTPVPLFQANMLRGGADDPLGGRQYDVARDGRFLINRVQDTVISPITLIQNWNPEAKK